MPNPVIHWEIGVKNVDKAKKFYTELFEWKVDSNNPLNYGLTKTGGLGGKTIVPNTPVPGIGAFGMFADPDGNVVGVFKG